MQFIIGWIFIIFVCIICHLTTNSENYKASLQCEIRHGVMLVDIEDNRKCVMEGK